MSYSFVPFKNELITYKPYQMLISKKGLKVNTNNFHYLNKKNRDDYKQSLPRWLPTHLFEISIGVSLGYAILYLAKKGALLKFKVWTRV